MESAISEDYEHGLGGFVYVRGEFIGIPAILCITLVRIDTAEHTMVDTHLKVVSERVASQSSMVVLDIAFEILFQTLVLYERDRGCRIVIILVLRRFHRFRFDEEGAVEPDVPTIVTGHAEECAQVVLFALGIGIPEGHIAFTSSPECIPEASEHHIDIEACLHLQCRSAYNGKIGIRCGSVHITGMAE